MLNVTTPAAARRPSPMDRLATRPVAQELMEQREKRRKEWVAEVNKLFREPFIAKAPGADHECWGLIAIL